MITMKEQKKLDIQGLKGRDKALKEAVKHRDAFLTQAYVMLRNWAEAEDVVQEAFLVVVDKWETFKEGTSIFAWVKQIVRYKALEAIRRRGREKPTDETKLQHILVDSMDAFLVVEKAEHQKRLTEALQHCISLLGNTALKILVGFYWRAETCETMSRTLNRSSNSIRLMLSRTRRQLQQCLSRTLQPTEMKS